MTEMQPIPTTTDAGIPVPSDDHSLTIGPDGPILLQDHYLIEQMANFNRERVPERQPHAKGSGAFGHFEVTHDVSEFTRAAVFQPGTRTETLIRFSTVAGERGSPDAWRDPRGFSLRFYTDEGNLDIVGNNTPVFFIRDGLKFQHFIRCRSAAPTTTAATTTCSGISGPLTGERPPGGVAVRRSRYPGHLAEHERLRVAHLQLDQRRRADLLGEIPFHLRSGHPGSDPGRGRPAGQRPRRLPHPRPASGDQTRRVPELDAEDADHAVRGRQDLPV